MMLGERSYGHVRPWSSTADDPYVGGVGLGGGSEDYSQLFSLQALQRYLPSNADEGILDFQVPDSEGGGGGGDGDLLPVDAHTCDHFRMFEFKVRKCTRGRSHDWTECPFAHPGEKARRRDPRKYHYSGAACPDFRKGGGCRKGDACEFAHGVFECWLHPARYRTQPCKDGMACRRRVCFFAHSPDQLRVLSPRGGADSSPGRLVLAEPASPTAADSPPMSPMKAGGSVNEIVASLRQLQLKSAISSSVLGAGGACSSPRLKISPTGYYSLPTTPTRAVARPGIGYFEEEMEEPIMERVESGRDLRAKMFEKLSKENPLDRADPDPNPNPDVGWVSELVK